MMKSSGIPLDKSGATESESLKDALSSFMQATFTKQLSEQQKAYRAWYSANGDFEHRHTCGLYLNTKVGQNKPPALIVYLDTNAIMQDFTTNKDIYLIRLQNIGFEVSDIQFRLSKEPKKQSAPQKIEDLKQNQETLVTDKVDLTDEEILWAQEMAQRAPEAIRENVYKAIIASVARQRLKNT